MRKIKQFVNIPEVPIRGASGGAICWEPIDFGPLKEKKIPKYKMTKAALIKALGKYPDDMIVLVNGYEGDYSGLRIRKIKTYEKSHREDYFGRFGEIDTGEGVVNKIDAILLERDSSK